jgi:hypothetical protein
MLVYLLNMFRALLCPSSGVQYSELPHMMSSTGIATWGRVELAAQLYSTPGSNTSAGHQCGSHYTVLLMMGILMPETC